MVSHREKKTEMINIVKKKEKEKEKGKEKDIEKDKEKEKEKEKEKGAHISIHAVSPLIMKAVVHVITHQQQ